jgi:hypothetical protein
MLSFSEPVKKASKLRPRSTKVNEILLRQNRRNSKLFAIDLVGAVERFKKLVPTEGIQGLIIRSDFQKIMSLIPWESLATLLEPCFERLDDSVNQNGKVVTSHLEMQIPNRVAKAALPPPKNPLLRYDTKNPRISNFIRRRSGELITTFESGIHRVVANMVTESMQHALDPKKSAEMIVGSIGLNDRQAAALKRYTDSLNEQDITPARASILSAQYEDRLLDSRAMTIARTEIAFSNNYGQLYVWQDAANEDLIDRHTARKVWQVDGEPCPICIEMDQKSVLLYGSWTLPNGDVVEVPNEAHPNCECIMWLDIDGDTAEE